MRFLPHLLAAVLTTTTLLPQIAAACGGPYADYNPAPRVLAVSSHSVPAKNDGQHWIRRAFVVLEKSIDADDKAWQWLAPYTYDPTHILTMSRLETPMEVTLVGPRGARVVKADRQVALSRDWHIGHDQKRLALEVPIGEHDQFAVAIAGRATDARWHEIGDRKHSAATVWWLQKQGIKNAEYVRVQHIAGLTLDFVEYYADGLTHIIARDGDRQVGLAADANLRGAVTTAGRTFAVFMSKQGQIGLLELPAMTKA
jgi:hypothetical protein